MEISQLQVGNWRFIVQRSQIYLSLCIFILWKRTYLFAFMVTDQEMANSFLKWNRKGEHCLERILWQLFPGKMLRTVHRKISKQANEMWEKIVGKRTWKDSGKLCVFTDKMSHHFQVLFVCNLASCSKEMESCAILSKKLFSQLFNCYKGIQIWFFLAFYKSFNLLIVHFVEITQIFLQVVLVYSLYLHVHTCRCTAIYLLMLVGGLRIYFKLTWYISSTKY